MKFLLMTNLTLIIPCTLDLKQQGRNADPRRQPDVQYRELPVHGGRDHQRAALVRWRNRRRELGAHRGALPQLVSMIPGY